MMDKRSLLHKYFPGIRDFREVQEPTIDALLEGNNVLCLMPTGGGKSLIYQIAGLAMEKTTLVISPLVALMSQQCEQLAEKGISAINFSGMDYRYYIPSTIRAVEGYGEKRHLVQLDRCQENPRCYNCEVNLYFYKST